MLDIEEVKNILLDIQFERDNLKKRAAVLRVKASRYKKLLVNLKQIEENENEKTI